MAIRSKKSRASRLMIESLEGREVPASLVTGVIAGGVLTLTGSEEADTFTIRDTGTDIEVTGVGATKIATETAANTPVTFAGVTGIKLILKGGNDDVSQLVPVTGVYALGLTGVFSADMGDGNNTLTLTDSSDQSTAMSLGSFEYTGGEGSDTVILGNTNTIAMAPPGATTITGKVTFDGDIGNNSFEIDNGTVDSVTYTGLEGNDDLTLDTVTVTKNVTADFGYGADSRFDIGVVALIAATVKGNVSAKGVGSEVDVKTFGTTKVQGPTGITVDAGLNGYSNVDGRSGALDVSAGGISVKGKNGSSEVDLGAATVKMSVVVNNSNARANLNEGGALSVGGVQVTGANGASANVGSDDFTATVTGSVSVSSSQGSAYLEVAGTKADLKGSVSVNGHFSAGINDIVNDNGAMTTGAAHYFSTVSATSAARGAYFDKFNGDGSVTVDGVVSLKGPDSAGLSMNSPGDKTFMKNVIASSSLDDVYVDNYNGKATFGGNVSLTGYYTALNLSSAAAGSSVAGELKLNGGAGGDTVNIFGTTVSGNATFNLGTGDAFVTVSAIGTTKTSFAKNLSITTGAGADEITLNGVTVGGIAKINTGSAADTVSIDNATFAKTFSLDTGGGDDTLNIARNNTDLPTTFTGKATIKMGAGNDTMAIGDTTGDIASFGAGSTADGGTGYNLYDPQAGQGPILTLAVSTNFTDLTP